MQVGITEMLCSVHQNPLQLNCATCGQLHFHYNQYYYISYINSTTWLVFFSNNAAHPLSHQWNILLSTAFSSWCAAGYPKFAQIVIGRWLLRAMEYLVPKGVIVSVARILPLTYQWRVAVLSQGWWWMVCGLHSSLHCCMLLGYLVAANTLSDARC